MSRPTIQQLCACGLSPEQAHHLSPQIQVCLTQPHPWQGLSRLLKPEAPFALHRLLYDVAYSTRSASQGPPPAWTPSADEMASTNLSGLIKASGQTDYAGFLSWSSQEPEAFWALMLHHLLPGLRADSDPILQHGSVPGQPQWLPQTRFNIAAQCFTGDTNKTAIIYHKDDQIHRMSYGQLQHLAHRVARGLNALDLPPESPIALVLPMHPEAVAIYLGCVLAGMVVVGIADSFAAEEIQRRLELSQARAIFTQDHIVRGAKKIPLYPRIKEAQAPPAIVLGDPGVLRSEDTFFKNFLSKDDSFTPILRPATASTNILFSSGTTGDPKAIPWDQTTPIKCAVDGHLLQDIKSRDVIAWPTNLGWMMGPWLIYAGLINRACIALYDDQPTDQGFCRFIDQSKVSILGTVPSLVRAWRQSGAIDGCDWSRIRLFSSTGECSDPDDMLYLMSRASYRPVIEYCGGTEIGGAYISGTLLQPCSPSTFTTPTPGLDFVVLDNDGQLSEAGEAFLIPPSIGFSSTLLNRDHQQAYYADTPSHPLSGVALRRHGDRLCCLPGGYYRAEGRADDAMNLGGIKISAAEIERLLNRLPQVGETAAIACPPPGGGPDRLIIYAVSTLAATQLLTVFRQTIRQRLNPLFKVHAVEVVDALPRTASNKVMRRLLRQRYTEHEDQDSTE